MKKIALILASLGLLTTSVMADKSMLGQQLPSLKVDFMGPKPEYTGKPMLLEFWATWCPPCRTSIPHLNELYKKYKDQGLVVIGVTDEPNSVIRQFTKEVPIDYPVATDRGGKFSADFGIKGIPHAFIIDKSGKIVWEGHPGHLTDADIEAVLK